MFYAGCKLNIAAPEDGRAPAATPANTFGRKSLWDFKPRRASVRWPRADWFSVRREFPLGETTGQSQHLGPEAAFCRRMNDGFQSHAQPTKPRQGRHLCRIAFTDFSSSVRSGIFLSATRCSSYGVGDYYETNYYKDAAPTALRFISLMTCWLLAPKTVLF